jgi:hypothetical protein
MARGRLSKLNAGLPNLCSPDDSLTKLLPELIYGQWGIQRSWRHGTARPQRQAINTAGRTAEEKNAKPNLESEMLAMLPKPRFQRHIFKFALGLFLALDHFDSSVRQH